MPINTIPQKRGGKPFQLTIGKDAGKTKLYFLPELKDALYNQNERIYPLEMYTRFDGVECDGSVESIRTEWYIVRLAENGKPQPETIRPFGTMKTNGQDLYYFVMGLGDAILVSMANGFVRSLMGHNNKPVFATTPIKDEAGNVLVPAGGVIPYTEEELEEAPTYDYA